MTLRALAAVRSASSQRAQKQPPSRCACGRSTINVRPGLVGLLKKLDLLPREATPHLSTSAVQKDEQQQARQAACLLSICGVWIDSPSLEPMECLESRYGWTLRSK